MRGKILNLCTEVSKDVDFTADNLVSGKMIDSVEMISIISAISDEFDIDIPFEEIKPENFDSVDRMVALVGKYV